MKTWEKFSAGVATAAAVSGMIWAFVDHIKKPTPPVATFSQSGQYGVQGENISNSNIATSGGTISINARTPPSSAKEAARQRLHDSGIEYSDERFAEALSSHDADTVDTFMQAGMPMSTNNFRVFSVYAYDPQVAAVLLKYDVTSGCQTDAGAAYIYPSLREPHLSFVVAACSKDSVRTRLRATIEETKAQDAQTQANNALNANRRQKQVDDCVNLYGHGMEGAALIDMREHCTTMQGHSGPIEVDSKRIGLLEKSLEMLSNNK